MILQENSQIYTGCGTFLKIIPNKFIKDETVRGGDGGVAKS
jgi:hypothetical protein